MSFLEKNINTIKEYKPEIYDGLNKILKDKNHSSEAFKLIDTKKGSKTVEIKKNGETVRLNSLYNPKKEAERWVKQYDFDNIGVSLVMFGLANGVFANAMLSNLKKDSLVFIVEPDISLFVYCLENFDMTNVLSDTRLHLYIDRINYSDFYFGMLQHFHWSMLPTMIVCVYPGMDKIYKHETEEFFADVQKMYTAESSANYTAGYLSRLCTENTIKNMHFIKKSNYVSELSEVLPADVPIIIVAAGPSLDKNIDELKRAKGKAFILATDTAVKFLLAHDAPFDAIVTLDARKNPAHLSDERCFGYPMFTIMDARNSILEMNNGRKIWINGSAFLSTLYLKHNKKFDEYISGGSVATAAFNIAKAMRAKTIVLIGQDLAFSGDSTHAGGVANHADDKKNGIVYVEDINGNQIKSRGDWLIYIDWFNSAIEEIKENVDVIDATEGGAKLKGSKIMKLSDVIDNYCKDDFDFSSILKNIKPTFSGADYNQIKDELLHLDKELVNIEIYAKDGEKAAEEMTSLIKSGKINPKKENRCLKTVKKANNFISKQMIYTILDDYIAGDLNEKLMDINCLTDDENENVIKTYDIAKFTFEAILKGVKTIKPILEEALKSV